MFGKVATVTYTQGSQMGIRHKIRRKIQFRLLNLRSMVRRVIARYIPFGAFTSDTDVYDSREDHFIFGIKKAFAAEYESLEIAVAVAEDAVAKARADIEYARAAVGVKTEQETKRLGNLQTELKRLTGALRGKQHSLKLCHPPTDAVLRMQYREIMRIPGIRELRVNASRIEYRTEALYGRDFHDQWRRIGRFEISFDLVHPDLRSFRWLNRDGVRAQVEMNKTVTYHGPPNIEQKADGFGAVNCAGNDAQSFIRSGGRDKDYATLVAFSVRYPECVGSLSKKAIIELWPLVDEQEVPVWYFEQIEI